MRVPDSFDEFEESQASLDRLDRHAPEILQRYRQIEADHPDEDYVGLIVERGNDVFAPMFEEKARQEGLAEPPDRFTSLMPREDMIGLLEAAYPGMAEQLPARIPGKVLPVVYFGKHGVRAKAQPY
ncbi:MAG: hypothetical protein R3F30_09205 [Planctomycetota bacterium]